MSLRPPPTIPYKDNWTCSSDSDVARSSKDIYNAFSEISKAIILEFSMWSYSSCAKLYQKNNVLTVFIIGIKELCTALADTETGFNHYPGQRDKRSDYRASVLMKNRLHHESGEPIEEPIHPGQQTRTNTTRSKSFLRRLLLDQHTGWEYRPSSTSFSWWYASESSWK